MDLRQPTWSEAQQVVLYEPATNPIFAKGYAAIPLDVIADACIAGLGPTCMAVAMRAALATPAEALARLGWRRVEKLP